MDDPELLQVGKSGCKIEWLFLRKQQAMERLIIDIESVEKARELQSVLSELFFVSQVVALHNVDPLPVPAYDSENDFEIEMARRISELESGAVAGLSIEDVQAEASRRSRKRA